MKDALARFSLPSQYFGQGVILRQAEINTLSLIGLCLFSLLLLTMAPFLGLPVVRLAFPLIASWLLLRKTPDRFAPTVLFPAIYLLWFWLGNIPLLIDDRAAAPLAGNPANQIWFFCLIGLVGYLAGTLLIRGRDDNAQALKQVLGAWLENPLFLFLTVLALGILAAWMIIAATDGITIFKDNVDTSRLEVSGQHRFAYQILVFFSNIMLPLNFLYLWTSERTKFRVALYAFSILIVCIFISIGSRGLVLPAILTTFALRHYLRKPWNTRHILIAGFVLLPLLSITGYYRSVQHFGPAYVRDLVDLGMPVQLQPFTNIYLYVRAPVETFRNVLGVIPAAHPYQYGKVSLGFILQLLPGRHPSSDFFFKEVLGHNNDGFGEPASLLGSFYADFGAAGIFLGMTITGILTRLVYVSSFRGSLGWILVYCFLWQKLVGSLYGSLFTYIDELLVPLAWLISIWVLTDGQLPFKRRASTDVRRIDSHR